MKPELVNRPGVKPVTIECEPVKRPVLKSTAVMPVDCEVAAKKPVNAVPVINKSGAVVTNAKYTQSKQSVNTHVQRARTASPALRPEMTPYFPSQPPWIEQDDNFGYFVDYQDDHVSQQNNIGVSEESHEHLQPRKGLLPSIRANTQSVMVSPPSNQAKLLPSRRHSTTPRADKKQYVEVMPYLCPTQNTTL